ncbi:MAG: tetratricopeptide repeat protein [Planctomycetes bacterium]|nr:tetratricopeptide repeat protein [Planctomycetota bacterium]
MAIASLPPYAAPLAAGDRLTPVQIRRLRQAFASDREEREKLVAAIGEGLGFERDRYRMALVHYAVGRYADAAELLDERDAHGALLLGMIHAELGDHAEARACLQVASKSLPEARAELVRALVAAHALDEAERVLTQVPAGAERDFATGQLAEAKGQIEAAINAYEAALQGDHEHVEAAFRIGCLLDRIGDDELAADHYLICADTWPAYLPGVINLGILYDERGEPNAAIDCFRQVLAYEPRHARARALLRDAKASRTMYYDEKEERERERMDKVMRTSVNDFELSVRSRNCLTKMNIYTVGDLLRITESEMLAYKNFGETSLKEVRDALAQRGLRLGMFKNEGDHGQTKVDQRMLGESVDRLDLSPRAAQVVHELGISRIGDLLQYTDLDLYKAKGSGQSVVQELCTALGACGASVRKPEVRD